MSPDLPNEHTVGCEKNIGSAMFTLKCLVCQTSSQCKTLQMTDVGIAQTTVICKSVMFKVMVYINCKTVKIII